MPYQMYKNEQRKFLTTDERTNFIKSAQNFSPKEKTFCLTVANTGCLIIEALNIQFIDIDFEKRHIAIRTLRKRNGVPIRYVPLSNALLIELRTAHYNSELKFTSTERIWSWSRGTGYRKIINVMERSEISGLHATPLGLRHSFGIHCIEKEIPLNFIQKWMGHSSIEITCQYLQLFKQDEHEFAKRIWI